jgi:hypothetical protein
MPTTSYVKLLPRRDSRANLAAVTLAANEIAVATDSDYRGIQVGDGATLGGHSVAFGNPMTAIGDILIATTSGKPTRLAIGSPGYALVVNPSGNGYLFTPSVGGGSTTRAVTVTTATGAQNDFDFDGSGILFCNNASNLLLYGLADGAKGMELLVAPKGAGAVYLYHEMTSSLTANRINTRFVSTANALIIANSGSARLVYDDIAQRWIVIDWASGVPTGAQNYTELDRASDQTANSGSAAYVSFTTEISNVFGVFSSGNPTRVTVPQGQGGLWMFSIRMWANEVLTGQVQFGVRKNGSTFLFTDDRYMSGATLQNTMTFPVQLVAGDYLEFYYYQASGSNKTFQCPLFTCARLA